MAQVRLQSIGESLLILHASGEVFKCIPKRQVRGISIVRDGLVKLEWAGMCGGSCGDILLSYQEVLEPVSASSSELLNNINSLLVIGSGGGSGSIDTSLLAKEALQVSTKTVLEAANALLQNLLIALGQSNTLQTNQVTTLDAVKTSVDAFKIDFDNTIPANHIEIKGQLIGLDTGLQQAVTHLQNVLNGVGQTNINLDTNSTALSNLLASLNEFKTIYQTYSGNFQTTYSDNSIALLNVTNSLITAVDQVDTHTQEVKTEVQNLNTPLSNIQTALEDLVVIKQKVTDINLAHVFSQPYRIDEAAEGVVYKGYTLTIGATDDATVWAISKEVKLLNVTSLLWANGTKEFNQIWDNRAGLVYT